MRDALVSIGRLGRAASALLLDRAWPARRGGLPFSLAGLTADWLTRALAAGAPGVRVAGFEPLDHHTGTTTRARIALHYAERGEDSGLPDTLFVKIAPRAALQRLFLTCTGLGRNEVGFYRELRDGLPVRAPEPYAAESSRGGRHFVLLLEDLTASGARFPAIGHHASLEDARRLARELARLHAGFWESRRFHADLAWVPCHENRRRDMPWERFVTGQMVRIAARRFAGEFPPEFGELAELILTRRDDLESLWAAGERTLVHGDCHMGNLFFEGGGVGLLDWQLTGRAPGMRDVSYFLCNSLPSDLRRGHERALIRSYLEALAAEGVAAPDFERAWRQHRLFAIYTWLAAAFTAAAGASLQPREVGMAALRRTTRAALDLDSLGCARAALAA